ncbi:hypothetical protein LKL35_08550 [Streptomyces sp. ET3-23]|uniref:hypothetical protein n=1 Tax=Streptomyces sp. ET3-23 TaxID=2885643 RepID=UPI001D1093D4|nr:hypothetical protein [Streptomyces sp. ET3-23]MCC2275471.1 hypothetical protein [Streptomyces sp. ET3-23]
MPPTRSHIRGNEAPEGTELHIVGVSGIACGLTHDDPEVVERGRRTLRRLHRTQSA